MRTDNFPVVYVHCRYDGVAMQAVPSQGRTCVRAEHRCYCAIRQAANPLHAPPTLGLHMIN